MYPPYASKNCKIHKAYANSMDKECLEKEMHFIFDNWGLLEFLGMIIHCAEVYNGEQEEVGYL